ncbi:twin-arginine translocation signal domain-containing protein [Thermodesulfobacterium sp. TA1]|uniref:iron hydrogenase small subunit n=1 Tax=Thermodesulfobacterium sp. TA1 TaxID=2234087 RepID=UPI001231E2D2|nr:iron hydrogenase small subunit [Thermodesulfobacterium sp. TA1]QER42605.1 twin-arginine translocation signal domain-containing protein [Thermodesulfobacterium sp. TA1]
MGEITRRDFIKILGISSVVLGVGLPETVYSQETTKNFFETSVGREKLELIKARQTNLYKDDKIVREKFKLAASHENPMIKKFYQEFAHYPLSEISEMLLHTHYKKRG